jgi:uncharacterized membrane protein
MVGMAPSKGSDGKGSELASQPAMTFTSTTTHLAVAGIAGVIGAVITGVTRSWQFAAVAGWDVMAAVFVTWIWVTIWPRDAESTASHAVREDPARPVADLLLVGASVASLVGIGFIIAASGNSKGDGKAAYVAFAVATVFLSWAVVHTAYTLRYARLFYSGKAGGLNFHQIPDGDPQYSDFAYVSLTVGMTFQVSDPEVNSTVMRATILRQALLAYLFGVVIIAIVINLVAGLTK